MRSDGADRVALENPRIVDEQARKEVEGKGMGEGRREKGEGRREEGGGKTKSATK